MARNILIDRVESTPESDRWRVIGTVDGAPTEAVGHLSAVLKHYPPEAYGSDGHHQPGAAPRLMTDDEATAYGRALLDAACPEAPRTLTLAQALQWLEARRAAGQETGHAPAG